MRTAKSILSEIANKHRNSDLRMDHPDVATVIDGLIKEASVIARPSSFDPPIAQALLSEFVKRYGKIIYEADEESGHHDATAYFERDLHRMIQAFVMEAIKPWRDAMADAAMRTAGPLRFFADVATEPASETELWRQQHRGVWYRMVLREGLLEFQINSGIDTSPEHECWSVDWAR